MHSSKHSSLSPNQFLRPQRDLSPSNKQRGSKYYSAQQVKGMIKSYIEPKILYLRNQLQEKNRVIEFLNGKLDENDERIKKLYNYAQNVIRRQKQLDKPETNLPIINQVLNDKLKQYWQTVNGQIQKLKQTLTQNSSHNTNKLQTRIQHQLQSIRTKATQYIESQRVRNNNYWLKIKQALNRINSRVNKINESLLNAVQNVEEIKRQLGGESQLLVSQMQKSKNVVRKLVELKKSVTNIYQNYQDVLQLQDKFKNRLNEMRSQEDKRVERYTQEIEFTDENSRNDEFMTTPMGGGNTFPMFRKKPYSFINTQQDKIHNNYLQTQPQSYNQPPTRITSSKQPQNFDNFGRQENFALQYSRDDNGSEMFYHHQPSSVNNKETEDKFSTKYYVGNVSNKKAEGSSNSHSTSNFLGQVSPIKGGATTQCSKWQNGVNSPTELSCLNSSINALRQGASRSTSFVNLSLGNRSQMSESLRQRLEEIIELKNLAKPLIVYLDEINYLKNNEGNYIFDTRGNMFKVNIEEGKDLERLGLIRFIEKGNSQHNSNSKMMKKDQLLDKMYVAQTNPVKRAHTQGPSKNKSIAIMKTGI